MLLHDSSQQGTVLEV